MRSSPTQSGSGHLVSNNQNVSSAASANAFPPQQSDLGADSALSVDAAQRRVEFKLDQIKHAYEEYLEDVGLAITHASEANAVQRSLPSLVQYMKTIPFLGEVKHRHEEQQKSKDTTKKSSFTNLGSTIRTKIVDRKMLRQDTVVCFISILGVILMLVASILAWKPKQHVGGPLYACSAAGPDYRKEKLTDVTVVSIQVLNWIILATSLMCLVAILQYYREINRTKQIEWCKLNGIEIMPRRNAYNFWKSSYPFSLMLELFIHLIIPYPWFNSLTELENGHENNSKYLELFMLLRCYTILRVLHHWSPLYRFRHDIVAATPELKSANFQVRFSDTMKVYCYEYTFLTGILMYAFVTLVGGFAVFVAERDSNNGCDPVPRPPGIGGFGFNSWFDGIYCMVVSVRTIGYGDLKPITIVGRVLTIVFQFAGMAVEAFLGSVVINKIAQSKEEKIIDEYLKSFYSWHELRVASAMLIQATWKTSLRYKYLRNIIAADEMERVLRTAKRRKEFLTKMRVGTSAFPVPAYDDLNNELKAIGMQFKVRKEAQTNAALQQMLRHSRSMQQMNITNQLELDEVVHDSTDHIFDRMPYLRRKEEEVDAPVLIYRSKRLFTQDVDVARWGRNASAKLPEGLKAVRTFTATKRVVGKMGERRIPIGSGHKADILLEAQKQFRESRLNFKRAMSSSSDHVIDSQLLIAYDLMVEAARKIKRNNIMLVGVRKVIRLELDAIDRLVKLSLSGGVD